MHLGAFGKHPGWADHIDDPGLDTQRLVDFKRAVYVEGIAACVESGKWEQLAPDHQVEGFAHVLYMRLPGEILIGRMWSSRDGKGRTRYPMAVVAHCAGVNAAWAVGVALPVLTALQRACESSATGAAVVAAINAARADLAHKAGQAAGGDEEFPPTADLQRAADDPALGPARQGLCRVMYQIEREIPEALPGAKPISRMFRMEDLARTHQLRVPALQEAAGAGAGVGSSLLGWSTLLLARIDPVHPFMLIAREDRPWVDLIVGEPMGQQMFCLRAGDKSMPLTTNIPYTIDAGFRQSLDRWVKGTGGADGSAARPSFFGKARGLMLAAGLGLLIGAAVARAEDPTPLLETIRAGTPMESIEAYRRLGLVRTSGLWPSTVGELQTEAALDSALRRAVSGLADGAERERALVEIGQERKRRLLRFMNEAQSADALRAGEANLPDFGLRRDDLDPRVRFNLGLVDLKQAAAAPSQPEQSVREAAERFVNTARGLPGGVAFLADAAPTVAGVERILAGNDEGAGAEPVRAGPNAAAMGPGATGAWLGFSEGLSGETLRFSAVDTGLPPLEFVRVDGVEGGTVYLSSTEVSVRQFGAIVQIRGAVSDLGRLIDRFDATDDPRHGPRTWEWGTGASTIVVAREWLASSFTPPGVSPYPVEGVPPRPTLDSPMQQVSPDAAVYMAVLCGCRLPTPAEWAAAHKQYDADTDLKSCNLRDRSWKRQQEFVVQSGAAGRHLQSGDAGAFGSDGGAAALGRFRDWDDGVLWMSEVRAGGGVVVHHLVGNVAEYVLVPAGAPANATPSAVREFVTAGAGGLSVIGGSALSDPAVDVAKPQPSPLGDSREGFSDVGFRLAFSAPGTGPAATTVAGRLDRLLTPLPLLPPPP